MRFAAIAILPAAIALAGCTTPITPNEAKPATQLFGSFSNPSNGNAAVVVTRDAGIMGSACNYHVSFDGTEAAVLSPGQSFKAYMAPGEHRLTAENNWACGGGLENTQIVVHDHKTLFINIGQYGGQQLAVKIGAEE